MLDIETGIYNRSSLLLGDEVMSHLSEAKVLVVGVGGVGSWCAEGLVRSGIRHLTIVDSDHVCVTNVNRQLMATTKTIGQSKVEVLRQRLLDINPAAEISAIHKVYCNEDRDFFHLDEYDYIIDAVDSLRDKASLILRACETKAVFFSSMGAALKVDPRNIQVDEFWKVQGCPLAATLRRRFKRAKTFPSRKFLCVFDPEVKENLGRKADFDTSQCNCPKASMDPSACSGKKLVNGSLVHITAMFGMMLSGLVVNDIYTKTINNTI